MSHGRLVRHLERAGLSIFALALAAACGADDPESTPRTQDDGRNWTVSSDDADDERDSAAPDAGSTEDAAAQADASGQTDTVSDATDEAHASEPESEITCRGGVADKAAFEGTTRDPAARLTVYIRDDCAAIGSVETSVDSGNYSVTVRGQIDDEGRLQMNGRTTRHHAEISGYLGAHTSTARVEASFDGTDIEREMPLERIE